MSELLLELFSEEIPAMMQQKAVAGYEEIFAKYFQEQTISFSSIKAYAGPRRITIHVSGISSYIEAITKEIKGPKTSAPENAIEGFCHSNGISKDLLTRQEIKGVEYFVYEQILAKQETKNVLKNTLMNPISAYVWPKSMFWGDYQIKWVRPLRNILCIFNGQTLDFKYGHLIANNKSFGHRFMSRKSFEVTSFAEYKQKLSDNFVVLDHSERKDYISRESSKIAGQMGLVIKEDIDLLEEVAGLVEYPQILLGKIDQKFLSVPSEVLSSSMKSHQKYFSLFDKKGNFAPYFLFVSNIAASNPELVIGGNEKVLSARLSDALYFYSQDLKTRLDQKSQKLDNVIFHAKLGSIGEKVQRVAKIVQYLLPNNENLIKAAMLCKSDIVSEVVGEFPNLQGIMGYYYAKYESLSEDIAVAIRDHYKPQGPSDSCPTSIAAFLALADKIDSLCGLMLAGEKPTGSKDPFALRRQALGIVRIILENKLAVNIVELVEVAVDNYSAYKDASLCGAKQIVEFLEDRVRHFLKDEYSIELVNAVLDLEKEPNLTDTKIKLDSLQEFIADGSYADLIVAYKRASNIVAGFVGKHTTINESLFDNDYEKNLYSFLQDYEPKIKAEIMEKNYAGSLKMLAAMRSPIASFFNNVMVKVDDQAVANNRLSLLGKTKQLFDQIAKFDQL
ncbi:MAG: glycine--tRNA ligase subunit beta [Rickettsiaceae bacterium]|nr:glycine--tRNA ligase subunit beta [Rickettsiaceae bacterium]